MSTPDSTTTQPPYVADGDTQAETSVRAIALGLVLAVVLGAANVYLGLYAGITVSASIPAAVISMALLRGVLRTGTILENNIVQTIASTAESLAAGVIFTVPALVLVGVWKDFAFWPTTLIAMLGGLLGVIFMVPLRRALIVERPDLIYPEGVACSQVLIAGQEGGSSIRTIVAGLGVGAVLKFLVGGIGIVKGTLEGAVVLGKSVFYFGSDISAALLGVGYIVGFRVAAQVFLGGAIGWIVAIPLMGGFAEGAALDAAWSTWDAQVRYMGVGAMLIGGLYSIVQVRKGIVGGISNLRTVGAGVEGETPRTERDMPLVALGTLFMLTVFGVFALYEYLIDSHLAAVAAAVVMVVASFLFVAVATYIVGLVGSSNSPVSGMTICALLMASAVMLALGIKGEAAILATLGVAGVVCCAACTSGDIAQDLKTGLLVGATPARQQWAEVLGVIAPAFIFAPVLTLLHREYVIGEGLRAPQAALFASLTEGIFGDGDLPLNMVAIGAGLGIAIIVADAVLVRRGGRFRLYIMPIAVGLYLPLSIAVPIAAGGALRSWLSRGRSDANDPGVLFGSGLVAGEALMGIGLAAFATLKWFPLTDAPNTLLTFIAGGMLLTLYVLSARKRPE